MSEQNRSHIGRVEIAKDTLQVLAESAAVHLASIASIVGSAVRGVTHEIGDWATDLFEMRDAAGRAAADHVPDADSERGAGGDADGGPRVAAAR